MANQFINALADTWNNGATTFHGIKLNVTDTASAAGSRLLTLQVGSTDKFSVSKAGAVVAAGSITGTALLAASNDGGALGASGTAWSDLFLASGGVINWAAGDVTITHSSNALAFAGASSGYSFDAAALPSSNDAAALGAAATSWSDLFLASGGVINWANGDAVVTHSSGILTVSTGDLRVTTAGTNAASVVTVGGTQTLTGKTMTSPTLNTPTISSPAFSGSVPTGLDASDTAKGLVEKATTAEFRAATGDKYPDGAVALAAMDWATLTDAATIAVDHAGGVNRKVTLGGNRAFGAPSNGKVGWPLNIWVVQDATGSRIPTWNSAYDFGDYGTPTGSTGANQADLYSFVCLSSGKFAFLGVRLRVD